MTTKRPIDSTIRAQQTYVEKMQARGLKSGLALGDAFLRGMRDLGYTDTGTAMNELIDNSIQAAAQNVHVIFDGENQPKTIAIWDDGVGMIPEMIRYSLMWGGTHRENDRSGFGRYGYGLPSASFSQGKRVTVFSRVADGELYKVTLDIDEISAGTAEYFTNNVPDIPTPVPATLPNWIEMYFKNQKITWQHGTLVVWEKLDRLSWKTAHHLKRTLLQNLGITYRNFIGQTVNIVVDGTVADKVDPLFITPGARFYDDGGVLAQALPPLSFEMKILENGKEKTGTIRVRFSYLPPNFPPDIKGPRFQIMKEHRGIIFCRNHRQIDVVTRAPGHTFVNNDRYWNVEVDYDPILDDEFAITTSKQRIIPSDRVWDHLHQEGVFKAIQNMRKQYERESATLRKNLATGNKTKDGKRASEKAMEDVQKFAGAPSSSRQRKGAERFDETVRQRAKQERRPEPEVEAELTIETTNQKYRVDFESLPGAPFFRVEQLGGQTVLFLNTAHPFFYKLYEGPDSTPVVQSSLEVLLFILGESELDATDDKATWYMWERNNWSRKLDIALNRMESVMSDTDRPDDF